MEDKRKICDLLLPVLQATDRFEYLIDLEYDTDNDEVILTFASGKTKRLCARFVTDIGLINHIIHSFER